MVRISQCDYWDPLASCAWGLWLNFLHISRSRSLIVVGKSNDLLIYDITNPCGAKSVMTLELIKAFIQSGAEIYFHLKRRDSLRHSYLKRQGLADAPFHFFLTASARWVIQECFESDSALANFFKSRDACQPADREIVDIICHSAVSKNPRTAQPQAFDDIPSGSLSEQESATLWPLIEQWEDTGREEDMRTLQLALEGIWAAHNPLFVARKEHA